MLALRLNSSLVSRTLKECLQPLAARTRCLRESNYRRSITTVQALTSWNIEGFRSNAFAPQIPATLPTLEVESPAAIRKWFTRNSNQFVGVDSDQSQTPGLDELFWSNYSDLVVPLEITRHRNEGSDKVDFDRIEGPISLLFNDLERTNGPEKSNHSIYLAQYDLRDLPQDLQDDLPIPSLVLHAGKGDLYSSSLWLGRSPTYTPLHRDPNPNLLMQLAGTKSVRLFRPEVGNAIFEYAQQLVDYQSKVSSKAATGPRSASFRGEEMMKGVERKVLHDLIWMESSDDLKNEALLQHAQHATVHRGQALFIPKGWWHSVKGVGNGVTASANWWFR